MNESQLKMCVLQHAVGRHERCPRGRCPFWDEQGCAIEAVRSDVETTPELAAYLLELRVRLAGGEGWSPFRLKAGRGSVASGADADAPPPPPDHP